MSTITIPNIVSPLEIDGVPVFNLHRDVPEPLWERAAAMVPEVPADGAFIDREVFGKSGVQHVIDAIVMRHNLSATGDAGSGKSTLFEVVAGRLRLPFVRVDCHPEMSLSYWMGRSTVGGLMTDRDDVQGWLDGDLLFALRYLPGIILFDEANRIDSTMTAPMMSMTSEARVVSVPEANIPMFKAKTLLFAATTNPSTYAGTFEMDEALSRRFKKLPWGYDRATEEVLIGSETLIDVAWAIRGHAHIRSILPTSTLLRFQAEVRYNGDAQSALGFLLADFKGVEQQAVEVTLDGRMPIIVDELLASA